MLAELPHPQPDGKEQCAHAHCEGRSPPPQAGADRGRRGPGLTGIGRRAPRG